MGATGLALGQGERPGVLSASALWARGGSDEGMSSFPRPWQLQQVSLRCLALLLLDPV